MLGIGEALQRTLGKRHLPTGRLAEEWQVLLDRSAAALEELQVRCASIQAELLALRQEREGNLAEHQRQLRERDREIACLEQLVADLKTVALAQRDDLRRAVADRADLNELIGRLRDMVARGQTPSPLDESPAPRGMVPAPDPGIGSDDDCGLDRLDADRDVVRFRQHMAFLMAA